MGVASVQYQLDGGNLGSPLTTSPYLFSWNTAGASNGSHTLTAIARDGAGNAGTSAGLTVNVSNAAGDTTPPTVSITRARGGNGSGTVNITANASDNVGVASVQYQIDGSNLGSALTTAPYTLSWNTNNTNNGNHTLTAIAKDAAGNTKTSAGVTVNVNNTAPVSANHITFVGADTTTLGNWKGVYGQDGNVMAQHSTLVPSYSSFNTGGAVNLYLLDLWATDPRALLKQYFSYSATERIESYWHTIISMDFLITSNDGGAHRIALYFADYQRQGRSNTVQVIDPGTNAVLDSRPLTDYSRRRLPGLQLQRERDVPDYQQQPRAVLADCAGERVLLRRRRHAAFRTAGRHDAADRFDHHARGRMRRSNGTVSLTASASDNVV